jgi:hypothetical protein
MLKKFSHQNMRGKWHILKKETEAQRGTARYTEADTKKTVA